MNFLTTWYLLYDKYMNFIKTLYLFTVYYLYRIQ